MGVKKRALIYKLMSELSREDLQFLIRENSISKLVVKRKMRKNGTNKIL